MFSPLLGIRIPPDHDFDGSSNSVNIVLIVKLPKNEEGSAIDIP